VLAHDLLEEDNIIFFWNHTHYTCLLFLSFSSFFSPAFPWIRTPISFPSSFFSFYYPSSFSVLPKRRERERDKRVRSGDGEGDQRERVGSREMKLREPRDETEIERVEGDGARSSMDRRRWCEFRPTLPVGRLWWSLGLDFRRNLRAWTRNPRPEPKNPWDPIFRWCSPASPPTNQSRFPALLRYGFSSPCLWFWLNFHLVCCWPNGLLVWCSLILDI